MIVAFEIFRFRQEDVMAFEVFWRLLLLVATMKLVVRAVQEYSIQVLESESPKTGRTRTAA